MTDLASAKWKECLTSDSALMAEPGEQLSESHAKRPLEMARTRLLVAGAVFTLCFSVLGMRLIGLAITEDDQIAHSTVKNQTSAPSAARADIFDRNGMLLATNLPSVSLFVDQTKVLDAEAAAEKIRRVLPEFSHETLVRRIKGKARYVWVKRGLTPDQEYDINRLGLPGFAFEREERRVYPQGDLFAHALGYTGVDNHGLSGIERGLDKTLTADTNSAPVTLSLDLRVQHVMAEELSRAISDFGGIGGAGVVLDVNTGEIIAMVSLPTYDPNGKKPKVDPDQFNRVTKGLYELGSTFKAFTLAMALDYGVVDLDGGYDASKPIRVSRFTINDDHPQNRWLSVPEIFMHSSNIGAAKMALDVGATRQRAFLKKIGLLDPVKLEIPEVSEPLSPAPKDWRDLSTMTIAFGHGVAVTPLHLVAGIAALVNGGVLRQPTLLKQPASAVAPGIQVIKAETSEIMRRLLRLVVTDGTGKKAAAPGYLVGGKTGTAEKPSATGYRKKSLISTFVGAFPMNAPRYVVFAMIDEPKGNESTFGFATAGWTAAPLISRLITRTAPLLGVEPVDEDAEPVRHELMIEALSSRPKLASF